MSTPAETVPFVPLRDQVLITPPIQPKEMRTKGFKDGPGLWLPGTTIPKYADTGVATVLDVGPDVKTIKVNDTVIFPGQCGRIIRFRSKEYWSIKEADVLMKVREGTEYVPPTTIDLSTNAGPRDIEEMDRHQGDY